jgi:hypothetical protein
MTSACVPSSLMLTWFTLPARAPWRRSREVLAERDDVDLLAAQLVDDHAHAPPRGADAGADRVDVVVVRPHRDLRAVPWLAGARLDLDDAVGDLRHLELEQRLISPGGCG